MNSVVRHVAAVGVFLSVAGLGAWTLAAETAPAPAPAPAPAASPVGVSTENAAAKAAVSAPVPLAAPAVVPATAPAPAVTPAPAPAKAAPAPAAKPDEKAAPKQEVSQEKAPAKQKAWLIISDRMSIGSLGPDMATEYGVQAEMTSRHFGITAHWAYFQPYPRLGHSLPSTVGFSQSFGFAFHYYALANVFPESQQGPNGFYFGPGLNILHMQKQGDPVTKGFISYALRGNAEKLAEKHYPKRSWEEWGLTKFDRTGYGRNFDLYGPILEIGYRHYWGHVSLGVETTLGYMFTDELSYWDSGFFFMFTPQVGFVW